MVKSHSRSLMKVIFLAIAVAGLSSTAAVAADRYLVLLDESTANSVIATRAVQQAGGEIVKEHLEIGVVVVESKDPKFEHRIESMPGVVGCTPDFKIQGKPAVPLDIVVAGPNGELIPAEDVVALPPQKIDQMADITRSHQKGGFVLDPTSAPFYPIQWNMRLMDADQAWAEGFLGEPEITIAIVDTGLDYKHPEIAGKVDLSRSASFIPEEDAFLQTLFPNAHPVADLHFHGTFIAAQAVCTTFRMGCVSPDATLIGVKILDRNLETTPSIIIAGILHAAAVGADVIDISIDMFMSCADDSDAIEAIRRSIVFAARSGAYMIGEPGGIDFGIDLDTNDPDEVQVPAEASELLTVISAVGPDDLFSDFSHFGTSVIDMAAPGGDSRGNLPDVAVVGPCSTFTQSPILGICNDLGGLVYIFLVHPFVASGHLAGAAALLEQQAGGMIDGDEIRDRIYSSLEDVGDPGCDKWYGRGRLNIFDALMLDDADVVDHSGQGLGCSNGTGCGNINDDL